MALVSSLPLLLRDLIYLTHLHLDVWQLSLLEALDRDASEAVISASLGDLSAKLSKLTYSLLAELHLSGSM